MKVTRKNGFTLVEILIVVVILGILAAIVIPQFSSASQEAKESNLKSNLQAIRSQIQLYNIKEGVYPTAATLSTDMVTDGYFRSFPANPFVDASVITTIVSSGTTPAYDGTSHWYWNTDTNDFVPNDDQSVVDHSTL